MPAVRRVNGVDVGSTSAATGTPAAASVTGPYTTAPPPNPATLTP